MISLSYILKGLWTFYETRFYYSHCNVVTLILLICFVSFFLSGPVVSIVWKLNKAIYQPFGTLASSYLLCNSDGLFANELVQSVNEVSRLLIG